MDLSIYLSWLSGLKAVMILVEGRAYYHVAGSQ